MYGCSPEAIRLQVRQIGRWLRAARQDREPGIAFLHASYGIGTLDMLRQLASDGEILAATGEDARTLGLALAEVQDAAQAALAGAARHAVG